MQRLSRDQMIRLSLTAVILLSGWALVPFINMPVRAAITWQTLIGVYEPELTVNEPLGMPGSIFAFTGSSYPANSQATVFVDGDPLGVVMTDGDGMATFMINTAGAANGQYNVTLEVDINAAATTGIELVEDGPVVMPPPGFTGPTFNLGHVIYLPSITRE